MTLGESWSKNSRQKLVILCQRNGEAGHTGVDVGSGP
jgi:hypothetical protein